MNDTLNQNAKVTDTEFDIHSIIEKRWSPRAFADRSISEEQMQELLEAARWSASSMNEQPWRYVYAHKGTPGFEQLWECLMPGNQPWAKNAAVLVVSMYKKTFSRNGRINSSAMHDLGMANAQMILQAAHRDIYAHMMGGFDKGKTSELLGLSEDTVPLCIIAFGYLGNPDQLEEPYKTRELNERKRLPVASFAKVL
jgi:nitroreductase